MKKLSAPTGHNSENPSTRQAAIKHSEKAKSQAQIQQELDDFAYFLLDLYEEKMVQQEQNPLHLIE